MSDTDPFVEAFKRLSGQRFTMNEASAAAEQAGSGLVQGWIACYDRYRAAGVPYGDTEEGMIRWYRETYRNAE